jgi:hypothetical protein
MQLESRKLLQDVMNALELLDQFAKGKKFALQAFVWVVGAA